MAFDWKSLLTVRNVVNGVGGVGILGLLIYVATTVGKTHDTVQVIDTTTQYTSALVKNEEAALDSVVDLTQENNAIAKETNAIAKGNSKKLDYIKDTCCPNCGNKAPLNLNVKPVDKPVVPSRDTTVRTVYVPVHDTVVKYVPKTPCDCDTTPKKPKYVLVPALKVISSPCY